MDFDPPDFNEDNVVGLERGASEGDEPTFRSEADRVAAERPHCNYCDDDPTHVFEVRVDGVYDLNENRMKGKRICDLCIERQGFTGWSYAAGGWPVRDPLGRAHPPETETEPPVDWREIGAALESRAVHRPAA